MSDFSLNFNDYERDDVFDIADSSYSEEKSKTDGSDKTLNAIKIVFVVLASCVVLEFFFYKFIIPCMKSPIVSVTGQKSYTADEIVDYLRPMNAKNWFDFDVESAVSILASISAVDSVSVRKSFPNKIYINIVEREPICMTFIDVDSHSVAVQIDKNGVIFPEKENLMQDSSIIPIISGLPVEHLSEGMRIPMKYRTLIEQIAEIKVLPQKYFAAISEICVVPKEYGNYELVLIPSSSKIRVLTDRTLNEDALKYMMVVLDVVNSIEPDVSEIDLRYGSVSYRIR